MEIQYTVEEAMTDVITGTDGPGTYAYEITEGLADTFVVKNTHTPQIEPTTKFKITYNLNGGTYNGSPEDIVEEYPVGSVITIHEAPVRDGYTFLYWKGSEYQPGDPYIVMADHTLVAQWQKNDEPVPPGPGPQPQPPVGPDRPDTGDHSNPYLWLALMIAALAGLISIIGVQLHRKRKNRS